MDAKKKAKDGRFLEQYGPAAYLDQVFTKIKPKEQEADSASANTASTRNGVKTEEPGKGKHTAKWDSCVSKVKGKSGDAVNAYAVCTKSLGHQSKGKITLKTRPFMERGDAIAPAGKTTPAERSTGYTKFKTILIQEGMGNFGDSFYYTREALESAIPVFEGAKIFADHPSKDEDENRPERSTKDILGYFQNVMIQEAEDGRAQLIGDVKILAAPAFDWARTLMTEAVEYSKSYPDKDFIGLSINAMGDSDEAALDDVLKQSIPESIKPKLQKAKEMGIETVRMVSVIDDAVSCDLVTEAGAGGKVLGLLESKKVTEDSMGKKKNKEAGDEKDQKSKAKPADAKPDNDGDADDQQEGGDEADQDGNHADAAQDKELIKKMIKKHLGDKEEPSEEEAQVAHEAYEAAMAMGHEGEEAEKMACSHLKIAKHMAAKKAESESEESESEETEESQESENESESEEGKKESSALKAQIIKLKGEIAGLKESVKKQDVAVEIERICKESKMSNTATKEFRTLVKEAKSKDEVLKAFKLFEAGYKNNKGGASIDFEGLMISTEKSAPVAEGNGIDFASCVKF